MHIKKLVGAKCYLAPLDLGDAEQYAIWLNDQDVAKFLTLSTAVITVDNEKAILPSLANEHNYGIIDMQSEQLIGNVGLVNMDNIHKTCEIGIFIGNKDYWSKGYGSEALSLLINYAYQTLNLNNLMLRVYSYNERAIKCYEKIGFRRIGAIREAKIRNRQKHDIILMDMLPDDFYSLKANSKYITE
jgi:RimJ/RimL family protein N-acetyltransferase